MYKRDRAKKLQMMRQRQMAVQTLRGGVVTSAAAANNHHQFAMLAGDAVTLGQYSGSAITSSGSSLHIKQEIQIPQVRERFDFFCTNRDVRRFDSREYLKNKYDHITD